MNDNFGIEVIYNTKTNISISYLDNVISFNIPRNQIRLLSVDEYEEINNYGIYFLVESKSQKLYVGKTDNILKRINEHSRNFEKNFEYVYVITTKSNSFSQTYIDYLEHYFINKLSQSNYWNLLNKDLRVRTPNLKHIEKINLNKLIVNIECLLSFAKINLREKEIKESNEIFKHKGVNFIFSSQGLFMLKDSIIYGNLKNEKTIVNENQKQRLDNTIKKRNFLIENWMENGWIKKIENNDNRYILLKDIEVNSPSEAAIFANGRISSNGWIDFKNGNNQSLADTYRK